jgi:hypothetical protein
LALGGRLADVRGFARVGVGVTAGAGGELGRDGAGGVDLAGWHGRGGGAGRAGRGRGRPRPGPASRAAAEGVRPSGCGTPFSHRRVSERAAV